MKSIITAICLLIFAKSYCQTTVKSQPNVSDLDQYLWSYSKNKDASEKPLIDFDVMDNWRAMENLSVCNDGSYFAYTINKMAYNDFAFNFFTVDSLVVQSTKNGQRTVFPGPAAGSFSADSKQYIFQDKNSLCFLQLSGMQERKIDNIASYKISQDKWLAYQLKDKDNIILQNLSIGKEKQFAASANYDFSNNGDWLVCQSKEKELTLYSLISGAERKFSSVEEYFLATNEKALLLKTSEGDKKALNFVALPSGDVKTIWMGMGKTQVGTYSIDGSGNQLVFTVVENSDAAKTGVWYYKTGMDKAVLKFNDEAKDIPGSEVVFTDNGKYIQFTLVTKPVLSGKSPKNMAGVEIWNYKDVYLQSVQAKLSNRSASYRALLNIETGKIRIKESNDKKLFQIHGDFALVKKDYKDLLGDRFWEKGDGANNDSTWIVDLRDSGYHLLPTRSNSLWFSPTGNYLVYFDNSKGCHYFSYDLNAATVRDISTNVPDNVLGIILDGRYAENPKSGNLAAWIENNGSVLVYGIYDIWKLDLTGKKPPINITNGLGEANSIILSLFTTDRSSADIPTVKANEGLLLRAYNRSTKQTGFYEKNDIKAGVPTKLYMGDYFMNEIGGCQDPNISSNAGQAPIKAKATNIWIVQRQSSNDAPNYYETTDFKKFRRLTDFQPQKNYQWFTEELVLFKHLDGKAGQGILYKPENFDSTKKYPVLIAFYGTFSNNMHQFPVPSYLDQAMEIGKSPVWFLNNGYLVFTPDIAVTPFKYGPKAYSVIEGAAQYLKTLPYVGSNKLGTGTHSWSGKLGAYIFTHSKSFAATAITEGFLYANPMNQYLSSKNSEGGLEAVEKGQQYGSLWENKEEWLDQTTILNADKSTSPLLLLCNKESTEDYQEQTFQFFNALRRLDKNVWWLKYDKGSHTLNDHNELKDYTIRYTQFFDHYLKYAPAPLWMTQGIPYKLKGIENRYELDPAGSCSLSGKDDCPICKAWNEQYKRTPAMFQREIKDWELDKDIADELERKIQERRKVLSKEGEVLTKEVMKMLSKK